MVYSMTGYGRVVSDIPGKKITVEIKGLNSKQCDINTRIPSYYREKELSIRNKLSKVLARGKIDFTIYVELVDENTNTIINESVYKSYYQQLTQIYDSMGETLPAAAQTEILRLPDVISPVHDELDEAEWRQVDEIIDLAIEKCNAYRNQEGTAMHKDLKNRIDAISTLVKAVEPLEKKRISHIKERLKNKLEEFIEPEKYDENRFEQELLFFLDKLDINEEIVRLTNHCSYFLQTLEEEGPVGKKLGFISQEIGREINTIGSKANDAEIQKLVVRMKDQLEKIKEQTLNVL